MTTLPDAGQLTASLSVVCWNPSAPSVHQSAALTGSTGLRQAVQTIGTWVGGSCSASAAAAACVVRVPGRGDRVRLGGGRVDLAGVRAGSRVTLARVRSVSVVTDLHRYQLR